MCWYWLSVTYSLASWAAVPFRLRARAITHECWFACLSARIVNAVTATGDVVGKLNYALTVVLPGSVNLLPLALFSMYLLPNVTYRKRRGGEKVHAALVHARIGCGGVGGRWCAVPRWLGCLHIYAGYYQSSGDKCLLCEEFPRSVLLWQCVSFPVFICLLLQTVYPVLNQLPGGVMSSDSYMLWYYFTIHKSNHWNGNFIFININGLLILFIYFSHDRQ